MVTANIHWGNRAFQRVLSSASKNSSKMKLGSNNIYKPDRYWWRSVVVPTQQNVTVANANSTRNLFLRKSRVLTDIMGTQTHSHSFTVVIVIASVFLFLTLTITAAVVVFCRKRNTVFALQKSEQDADYDFELDELTDVEYADAEFENDTEMCGIVRNKYARNSLQDEHEASPAKQPLVSHKATDTAEFASQYDPQFLTPHYTPNYSHLDEQAAYQKIVMATVLDKQGMARSLLSTASDSDDSLYEKRLYKMCKSQNKYYGIAGLLNADADSDSDTGLIKKTFRNFQGRLVCGGDKINYDSLTSIDSGQDGAVHTQRATSDNHTTTHTRLPQSVAWQHGQNTPKRQSQDCNLRHKDVELGAFHCPKTPADLTNHSSDSKSDQRGKYRGLRTSDTYCQHNGRCRHCHNKINFMHRTKSDSHLVARHYDDEFDFTEEMDENRM